MAGDYMCVASIAHSFEEPISATVTISVGIGPIIITKPRNHTANVGETVYIDCERTGDPLPTIKWHKNNHIIESMSERFKVR